MYIGKIEGVTAEYLDTDSLHCLYNQFYNDFMGRDMYNTSLFCLVSLPPSPLPTQYGFREHRRTIQYDLNNKLLSFYCIFHLHIRFTETRKGKHNRLSRGKNSIHCQEVGILRNMLNITLFSRHLISLLYKLPNISFQRSFKWERPRIHSTNEVFWEVTTHFLAQQIVLSVMS